MDISDAYFAGLFDGEGWFSLRRYSPVRQGGKREWAYQCSVHLCMREKFLIDEFVNRFGGGTKNIKSRSDRHSKYYEWRGGGQVALEFAEDMHGLLIAKRPQAVKIIDFQRAKNIAGPRPLTDELYEFYGQCYEDMKSLNMKGIGK